MPFVLQIHIGPVQSFIAAARRSRDLWFGSWLLSELSKAAARAIAVGNPAGVEALVFPAPTKLDDLDANSPLNVANKIVAVVSSPPKDLAEAAEKAIQARLDDVFAATFDARLGLSKADSTTAKAQIDQSREFYWVAVPIADGNYPEARALADALLAARKSVRDFSPVAWGSSRPKSSLDGAMESVIPEAVSGDAAKMYARYRARPGEQLSGLDLLKRRGRKTKDSEEHFPSTSHMAALPLGTQLQEKGEAVRSAWQAYLATLPQEVLDDERAYSLQLPLLDELDGSLLFTSRLADYLDDKEQRRTAATVLSKFYGAERKTNKPEIDEPDPYYALLAGDGDFMGETISRLDTPEKNREFSQKLAAFAGEAQTIVADHQGAVIYAGGDDVLALLPLHTALACAIAVAKTFQDTMKKYGAAGKSPSFSAGLVIVHHLEPLEDALNLARDAERTAKEMPDRQKNALAVILDKRSGAPRRVAGHWSAVDKPLAGLDGRLLRLVELYQAGAVPDRLAYQLRDTYLRLEGGSEDREKLDKIMLKEAERIIGRKHATGGAEKVAGEHRAALVEMMPAAMDARVFADELVIAAHLAKVCTLAGIYPSGAALPEVAP